MRAFLATVLALGVPISIGAFVACGAPSSFEHITGGPPLAEAGADTGPALLVEDPSLDAPRPTGPLSTSWINGSRPHFQWDLTAVGSIGAQVIACRDAACTGDKKTFPANGKDVVAPEDLAPGIWFWHLVSTTASTYGTKASPTWTMLVRGGTGTGAPGGAFADLNGDGIPDLIVGAAPPAPAIGLDFYLLLGTSADDPTAVNTDFASATLPVLAFSTASTSPHLITTDVDGDGLGDLVWSDSAVLSGATVPTPYVGLAQGGRSSGITFQLNLTAPTLPALDSLPNIVALGDVDGDGHGDIFATTLLETVLVFGAIDGLEQLSILDQLPKMPDPDSGALPPPTTPIAVGGYDRDGDGLSDLVTADYFTGPPFTLLHAKGQRMFEDLGVKFVDGTPVTTPPTAFTSGDIDGDGKSDLVFVTNLGTKPSVCVFGGAEQPLTANIACWTPTAPPADFPSALVTADLEGDGKDEILVGSSAGGIDVLTLPAPGQLVATHMAIDYGVSITVMLPGRPTPAVWAATRADGTSIALFRGKDQARVIKSDDFGGKFGVPIR